MTQEIYYSVQNVMVSLHIMYDNILFMINSFMNLTLMKITITFIPIPICNIGVNISGYCKQLQVNMVDTICDQIQNDVNLTLFFAEYNVQIKILTNILHYKSV